jgi:hypothetical protein
VLSKFYYKPRIATSAPLKVKLTEEMMMELMKIYTPKRELILYLKEYNHFEPFKEDII